MWRRRWLKKQARVKRAMRKPLVQSIFGKQLQHRWLWQVNKQGLAGGLALGLFIAFTPTLPFHMVLAIAGAIYFRVNLPIALAACWVTNPLTAVPIYMAAWKLGNFVIGESTLIDRFVDLFTENHGAMSSIIRNSVHLWTGSLLLAVAAAVGGNVFVRLLWNVVSGLIRAETHHRPHRTAGDMLKAMLPILLLLTGLTLAKTGIIDTAVLRFWTASHADLWWMPFVVTVALALTYAFGLPGAIGIIVLAGIIYAPLVATAVVIAGGVLGSLGAYRLADGLSPAASARNKASWIYHAFESPSGLVALVALRTLPGFPNTVINYSAGILRVPLPPFIASALIGFGIKGFIYTSAVNAIIHVSPATPLAALRIVLPFLACALLVVVGLAVEIRQRRLIPPEPGP